MSNIPLLERETTLQAEQHHSFEPLSCAHRQHYGVLSDHRTRQPNRINFNEHLQKAKVKGVEKEKKNPFNLLHSFIFSPGRHSQFSPTNHHHPPKKPKQKPPLPPSGSERGKPQSSGWVPAVSPTSGPTQNENPTNALPKHERKWKLGMGRGGGAQALPARQLL